MGPFNDYGTEMSGPGLVIQCPQIEAQTRIDHRSDAHIAIAFCAVVEFTVSL
jgi:hypothetical protein